MGRISKKRARQSPQCSVDNNSTIEQPSSLVTPGLTDPVMLDFTPVIQLPKISDMDYTSMLQNSSLEKARCELQHLTQQLAEMRSQVESFSALVCGVKQELDTLSPLKLLLTRDANPPVLEDVSKVSTVIDFIATEVTKRMISRQNVIVYNIPDKAPLRTVRHSILKAASLSDYSCQCLRLNKKHQKYSCPILFRFDSQSAADKLKRAEQLITATTKHKNARVVEDKTVIQRHKRLDTSHLGKVEQNTTDVKCLTTPLSTATESHDDNTYQHTAVKITGQTSDNHLSDDIDLDHTTSSNIRISSASLGDKMQTPKVQVKATISPLNNLGIMQNETKRSSKRKISSKEGSMISSTQREHNATMPTTSLYGKAGYKASLPNSNRLSSNEGRKHPQVVRNQLKHSAFKYQRKPSGEQVHDPFYYPVANSFVRNSRAPNTHQYALSLNNPSPYAYSDRVSGSSLPPYYFDYNYAHGGLLGHPPIYAHQRAAMLPNSNCSEHPNISEYYNNFFGIRQSLVPLAIQLAQTLAQTVRLPFQTNI
ncbi:hypothetical protein MN116_000498 [Schistosoma mekongi]|uniref:Uncharacterized protein n=1 Tax=Schistosoma mekongi TaxID=38744 RepID=A0AAE2D5Q0_SCHME|nr:hypothetical protein MN116_000498 [Schistosoma mekongi]